MVLRGELLDKPTYTFLQTMYEGNTGVCYKCEHEIFGEPIVQKTISLLGLDDAVAYDEPRLLHLMTHENLVEIREAQWDPEPRWAGLKAITFTMPYYEGKSVHDALAEGHQFSLGAAVEVTSGVLAALHYLHVSHRVLHRDIKPGNVMLDENRRHAYVGDLGSAAHMNDLGMTDARSGSLFYRPPEYASGIFSARSDLYGAGMTFIEMLNGPFPYEDLNPEVMEQRLSEGRRSLADRWFTFPPQVPDKLAQFVRSLLARDPARRPLDAAAARRVLLRIPFVDWEGEERSASGVRSWTGTWPPQVPKDRARTYKIELEPIANGPNRGYLRATARWQRPGSSNWRGLRSLDRRIQGENDSELRVFFSDVAAAAAQQVAAT